MDAEAGHRRAGDVFPSALISACRRIQLVENPRVFSKTTGFSEGDKLFAPPPLRSAKKKRAPRARVAPPPTLLASADPGRLANADFASRFVRVFKEPSRRIAEEPRTEGIASTPSIIRLTRDRARFNLSDPLAEFYKKRGFVRKWFGGGDLQSVLFCT